jgi:eukaryotic-like serine/threonine-protein kinase
VDDGWEKIKQVFDAALEMPEPQRMAYVETACMDKPEVVSAVREMLRSYSDDSLTRTSQPTDDTTHDAVFREGDLVANRFRVTRFINRGGMGEVYEVYDTRLRRATAMKTLRPEFQADAEALERFQREIVIAQNVGNDNLCRIYEFVEHPFRDRFSGDILLIPCFTMELLAGDNLGEFIRDHRPLTPGEALPLIRQVGSGLQILHENGIIHRDLKPSNVMLVPRRDGQTRAVVMDFGLSKPERPDSGFFETQITFQAGAPYSMAPELLRRERPGIASDIYSFGLLIDEMVTKSRAFTALSVQGLYFSKLWELPIPPGERAIGLPSSWEQTILQCLEKDPTLRPRSVREVIDALEG